jgi:hypothetical protein
MLGDFANTPSAARQNCTSFSAVHNARLSIFSLKAEADRHLRVGEQGPLVCLLDRRADEAAAEMNSTPGLKKRPE